MKYETYTLYEANIFGNFVKRDIPTNSPFISNSEITKYKHNYKYTIYNSFMDDVKQYKECLLLSGDDVEIISDLVKLTSRSLTSKSDKDYIEYIYIRFLIKPKDKRYLCFLLGRSDLSNKNL